MSKINALINPFTPYAQNAPIIFHRAARRPAGGRRGPGGAATGGPHNSSQQHSPLAGAP